VQCLESGIKLANKFINC